MNELLLHARCWTIHFLIPFNTHNHPLRKEFLSSLHYKYGNETSARLSNLCKDTQLGNGSSWPRCISAPKHMLFLFHKCISTRSQLSYLRHCTWEKVSWLWATLLALPPQLLRSQSNTGIWGWWKTRFSNGNFTQNKHHAPSVQQSFDSADLHFHPWQSLEITQIYWAMRWLNLTCVFKSLKHE